MSLLKVRLFTLEILELFEQPLIELTVEDKEVRIKLIHFMTLLISPHYRKTVALLLVISLAYV